MSFEAGLERITRHHEHSHALVDLGTYPGDGSLPVLASEVRRSSRIERLLGVTSTRKCMRSSRRR